MKQSTLQFQGDQHVLHEDWGEMLVGKHHPIVAILDLEGSTPEISLLDCVSDDVSLGQVSCFCSLISELFVFFL